MKKVLVTGSRGFIGKNLISALSRIDDVDLFTFNSDDSFDVLRSALHGVDIVYHLAGVNRPTDVEDFKKTNTDLTRTIVSFLSDLRKNTTIVLTSSTQAVLDNPYGISKRDAENIVIEYGKTTGALVYIYRLTNVFGKWARPNYNSVVATFCHNISHGLDITVSDRNKTIELVYIDDVIKSFLDILNNTVKPADDYFMSAGKTYNIALGELSDNIYQLRDIRNTLVVPDLSDDFMKCLYATYLSYVERNNFSYELDQKMDHRGLLAELFKSSHFGQIFFSKTNPGVIRGNHYHTTKTEKFCVVRGKAVIRFRHILEDQVFSYSVSGEKPVIVDIPPGYTHSIENISDEDMIVLFWADQIFDLHNPDTFYEEV
jgi:UDP-2-acetamido-2,6-beta-L-arabino-hexul-4-ose reductase